MIFISIIVGFLTGFFLGWKAIIGMVIGAAVALCSTSIAINNFFRDLRKPGGKEGP